MKHWLVVVQWMVLATATAAPAKAPKTAPPGNRFLFVLETSAAMSRLEHGGRQAIFDLIHSAVDGRMRKGDTYGIWTFNEHVAAGVYPMQVWDGQRNLEHASIAGRFLGTQRYEMEGNLPNLMKQLQAVVRVAKDLNVFIVTDGNSMVTGTPFDDDISASHRASVVKMVHTAKPLIITLTARNGQFTSGVVTLAGEPIVLAHLPARPSEAAAVASGVATNAPALRRGRGNESLTSTDSAESDRLVTSSPTASAPKKPLGEVVSIAIEDAATAARATNAGPLIATEPAPPPKGATRAIFIGPGDRVEVKTHDAPDTNAVAPPVVVITQAPGVATTQFNEAPAAIVSVPVLATPAAVAPAPVLATPMLVSAPVVATNPAPPKPQPLPAFVPAQIDVAARSPRDRVRDSLALWSGNMMLVFGGAFVGVGLLGALIYIRRMRGTKETSFISQGMDKLD